MKKTLITFTLAAALLSTSAGVYAVSNVNNPSTDKQYTIQVENTTSENFDIAKDPTNINKRIEYTKETSLREDGSEGLIFESWNNPKTFDTRIDNIIKNNGNVESYDSTYNKDMGRNIVMLKRDKNGNVVSGETEAVNKAGADYNTSLFSKNTFVAVKEKYASSEWTTDGTVVDKDGKTLKKISKTYAVSMTKPTGKDLTKGAQNQGQMKEIAYLDEATGLPEKVELYETDNNHKMNLVNTKVYEFKYIDTAGSIYDISGVNLKQLPQFNYNENTVG
ncbi:hypothetical protein [Clostridium beijerinckii]|uniref:hypothetical protein n=1 Tax=Clostridium beijerinckii TaxID=1520 RepID=UPI00098C2183|nr:hypothetical protein [Clostridium beijerinckii]MBA8933561.1 hypothetical protein [Clostridium beijerinckii]NRU37760.1 hypothetical protein [Clostridium beijerinckii]NSA98962.1 hypothetical protein [Clostridium beijerinckii]OOM55614.1 hypothetical protein CLOBI_44040 [Clostridium beijerinckii]OOM72547.1 hypothetical protein CLBEIC_05560 [Clostridium beijerinckii]